MEWNPFNRQPRAKSPEQSAQLEETSDQVLALLTNRAQVIAETAGVASDKLTKADIEQAAFAVALQAERSGNPFTEADFAEEGAIDSRLIDVMGARLSARPGAPSIHVMDSTGVHIKDVASKAEVGQETAKLRESEGASGI